jgi:hypothetical protein
MSTPVACEAGSCVIAVPSTIPVERENVKPPRENVKPPEAKDDGG